MKAPKSERKKKKKSRKQRENHDKRKRKSKPEMGKTANSSQQEYIFAIKHFIWFPHLWSHGCDMWIRGGVRVFSGVLKKTFSK